MCVCVQSQENQPKLYKKTIVIDILIEKSRNKFAGIFNSSGFDSL